MKKKIKNVVIIVALVVCAWVILIDHQCVPFKCEEDVLLIIKGVATLISVIALIVLIKTEETEND